MNQKTTCSLFLLASCCLLFFAPSSASGQTKWTSANGSFSIKAEFVKLKSGKVDLKKADGSVISVDMDQLSDAAQKQARRLHSEAQAAFRAEKKAAKAEAEAAAKEAAEEKEEEKNEMSNSGSSTKPPPNELPMNIPSGSTGPLGNNGGGKTKEPIRDTGPPAEMQLTCSAAVKKAQFGGESRKTEVVVTVNAIGGEANEALKFGKIEVTKIFDDKGFMLEPEKGRVTISDISESWINVYRDSTYSLPVVEHPKYGLAVEIRFPPNKKPKMIGQLTGNFSMLTGGQRIVQSLDNLAEHFGKRIKNEAIEEMGLKVKLGKIEEVESGVGSDMKFRDFQVSIEGDFQSLDRVWVGDENRQKLSELDGYSVNEEEEKLIYTFHFLENVPDNAVIYFESIEGAEEVKVPFQFGGLSVEGSTAK